MEVRERKHDGKATIVGEGGSCFLVTAEGERERREKRKKEGKEKWEFCVREMSLLKATDGHVRR